MINVQFYILLMLIVNFTILSCTTITHNIQQNGSAKYLYEIAQNKLTHKNYTGAIQDFLNLQKLYLPEPFPQQICLNLIYAYYKSKDFIPAKDLTQHFLKLYPNHKHLDYVLYMNGIINMNLDKYHLICSKKCFHIYQFDHNPIHANQAFHSFLKLMQDYPNSQYSIDAYKRLIFLKNRLAEYELSIIKFYNKKNAYVSVIARSEKILHYFPDTKAAQQALYYMRRSYQKIYLFDQANKINEIIIENAKTY